MREAMVEEQVAAQQSLSGPNSLVVLLDRAGGGG